MANTDHTLPASPSNPVGPGSWAAVPPPEPADWMADPLRYFLARLAIHALYASLIRELLHCRKTRVLFGDTVERLLEVLTSLLPAEADRATELDEVVLHLRNCTRMLRRRAGEEHADDYTPSRPAVVAFALAMSHSRLARLKLTQLLKRRMSANAEWFRVAAREPSAAFDAAVRTLLRGADGEPARWAEGLLKVLEVRVEKVRDLLNDPTPPPERDRDFCLLTRECYLLLHLLAVADLSALTPSLIDEVCQLHRETGGRMPDGFMKTATFDRLDSLVRYFPHPVGDFRQYLYEAVRQVAERPEGDTPESPGPQTKPKPRPRKKPARPAGEPTKGAVARAD